MRFQKQRYQQSPEHEPGKVNAPLRAPGGLGSTPPPALPGAHWVNRGRGSSARPHSVAQRGGWSDAGGVISPLHVLPSHWPSPRPSLAARAPRGHVTFAAIQATLWVYKTRTLRSLRASLQLETWGQDRGQLPWHFRPGRPVLHSDRFCSVTRWCS